LKIQEKHQFGTFLLVLANLVFLLVGTPTMAILHTGRVMTAPASINSPAETPLAMSLEQAHAFWDSTCKSIIVDQLNSNKYEPKIVGDAFATLNYLLLKQFGEFHMRLTPAFNEGGTNVVAYVKIDTDGKPVMVLSVASILQGYQEIMASGEASSNQQFEVFLVTTIVHGMIHMIGHVDSDPNNTVSQEAVIWAATCRQVLEPYVQAGYALDPTGKMIYDAWVESGHDRRSAKWSDFISSFCAPDANIRSAK